MSCRDDAKCLLKSARWISFALFLTFSLFASDGFCGELTDQAPGIVPRQEVSVFILHSYSQEYPWTRGQHQGFMESLQADKQYIFDVRAEYLDTKRMRYTPAYASQMASYLKAKQSNYNPAAIYVTDENALLVALAFAGNVFPGDPVFFSGIILPPSASL